MKPFQVLCSSRPTDYEFVEKNQCLPLYRYDANGNRLDNITDWGRAQFLEHYEESGLLATHRVANKPDSSISKEAIFHYTYAVLHHPAYRTKYELNLKREFPRLPFYADFFQWAAWGKALMALHIGYETVAPFALVRRNAKPKEKIAATPLFSETVGKNQLHQTDTSAVPKTPKPRLKADKLMGQIEIDDATTLSGIPPEAWAYKLGNRSALEWVLDQYKEKKPTDPTIAEKFNTYRLADYKDHVIDLLARVCTVSVETMRIIGQMPG